MSVVAWTLEYGGSVRALNAWGIRQPVVSFRSFEPDTLTFTIKRESVLAAPTFPTGADVILRRDGVGWFRGIVRKNPANANRQSEFDSYLVTNAWDSLQRTVYQQQWCIGGGLQYTPRVTLGQNVYGQKISIGRQVSEILTYALTKGVVVTAGTLPEAVECWRDEARDLTCAGAIRTILKLLPNAVSSCDYSSGGAPALSIQTNDVLAAVSLDATAGDQIVDLSGLSKRDDLVPAGVKFIYQGTNRHDEAGPGDGRTYTTLTVDSVGVPDVEGSIVALVELAANDTAPVGAAAAYWAALQVPQWEGTIRVKALNCAGQLRPGKVLNITNGRAEWATMRAVIQGVTENLLTGETDAELGPPEHLAVQDFIEQQQVARRRPTPTLFSSAQVCSLPDPLADPGDPETGVPPAATIANPDAGIDPKSLEAERAAQNLPKTEAFMDGEGSVLIEGCTGTDTFCAKVKGVLVSCS